MQLARLAVNSMIIGGALFTLYHFLSLAYADELSNRDSASDLLCALDRWSGLTVFEAVALAKKNDVPYRLITKRTQAITDDFIQDRVNLYLDETGHVEKASCG